MTFKFLPLAFLAAATLVQAPALAHGNMKPQHGGMVQMSGETLFELVVKPAGVQLFVSDDDEPVNAAGMTAKLGITAAGKTSEVMLKPAAGNQFTGAGVKIPAGAKVAVMVVNTATKARMGTTFTR
ncbi:hypothetical protein [Sphingomonas solaris]|uniref:Copper chaperone PCu(A)C n=1 Tax=Alterirhizorhabdus solaris TaxID=2529389 RepID=A0A558R5D5_9SPHN|nr:hypothetical protein [Sphingomonas solaris]TVV74586.1 hypothetical protein FOY91_09450 [Sphingomonas solaris]